MKQKTSTTQFRPKTAQDAHAPATAVQRSMPQVEVGFGIALIVLGTLIFIAFIGPLEIAVWLGGPIMALIGLAVAIASMIKRAGWAPVVFGLVAFALGSLLGIHDLLFPPAIAVMIHGGIAIATLVLGILQLASKKRFYARWLRRRSPTSE